MRTSISILARQRIALAIPCVIVAIAVSSINAHHAPRRSDRLAQMRDVLTAIDTSAPATAVDAERMLALVEAAEADGLSAADRRAAMTALYRELWQFRGLDVEAEQAAINAAAATAAGMFNAGARFSLDTHAPPPGAPEGHIAIVKRGRGPVPMLLVSDLGIPGEELYGGFMARNADRYTMYAVTLPGFGTARVPPRPAVMDFSRRPWLNAAERQIRELLNAEHLRDVVVVGTAAGGYFSAALAARHPAHIRAAVVVNGLVHAPLRALSDPTRPVDRGERLQRARSAAPIELRPALWPPASREAYGALIDNPPPGSLWTNFMAYATRDVERTRAWTLDHLSAANLWRQTRYTGELAATDLTDDLLALERPLLVIASLHDHLSPGVGVPAGAQWTALKLRNPNVPVTIATFGDVRHYASLDAAARFDEALERFLAGQTVPSSTHRAPAALASPFGSTSLYVGASEIRVEHFRPSVNDRAIWGALVPHGRLWRTGANEAPMITFSHDVRIEGQPLAAGAYTLLTIPGESEWTIIFNRLPHQFGTFAYDPAFDALRVRVGTQSSEFHEAFEIGAEPTRPAEATVTLRWERVAVPFRVALKGS